MRSLAKLQEAQALILALLGLCLGATIASAQVPHDMNYQGRLVDAVGAPLTGTVDFEIRIHEFIDLGFALYEEHHAAVALDDDGGFNVRIGTGTPITGTFDASLFTGVNRYLEVVIDGEVLAPRLPLSSVPYAMVAEGAVSLQGAPTIVDDIAANAAGISSNDADIAANATAISTNATGLSARAAADAAHDSAIAANATSISTNTSAISANASAISSNTTNISATSAAVAANATDIVNNELQLITHGVNFTVHGQNIDANSALILSNLANINGHSSNINSHANIQTAILDIGNAHAQGSFGSDFDHSNLQVLGDLNVTNRIFLGGFLLHQSDGRLKKNIEPIDDALETVQSLRGVTFHRTQQSDDDPLHYGFIAQEVLEVVPDLVALGPDGEHYAIDYSAFVGLLTEAIKEQAVQIDELEAANKDLLRAARSTAQRLQRIEARLSISAAR